MQVGVVGINHKSSPLVFREKVTRVFQKEFQDASDVVLLSTCNRAEVFFYAPSVAEKEIEIFAKLRNQITESFEHALYSYFGQDCFYHLGKVISGIDSAILGESDIQRQVKRSYEWARKRGDLPYELHYLFQKGLKIGKDMRSLFPLAHKSLPLPFVIQSIIEEKGKAIQDCSILFVGNSSINQQLIRFFKQRRCPQLTLCTRMQQKEFLIPKVISWDGLSRWQHHDVVICGTNHDRFVIDETKKKFKDVLLFDLSIPRNINPRLAHYLGLTLYNIDQIGEIACTRKNKKNILLCEHVIEKAVERQIQLFAKKKQAKWQRVASLSQGV